MNNVISVNLIKYSYIYMIYLPDHPFLTDQYKAIAIGVFGNNRMKRV